MRERLETFLAERSLNTSQISEVNRVLARDSQYAATCQLETEEDLPVLAVTAQITDPVRLSGSSPSLRPWRWDQWAVLIIVIFLPTFPNIPLSARSQQIKL